jgi:hypothetical protein
MRNRNIDYGREIDDNDNYNNTATRDPTIVRGGFKGERKLKRRDPEIITPEREMETTFTTKNIIRTRIYK